MTLRHKNVPRVKEPEKKINNLIGCPFTITTNGYIEVSVVIRTITLLQTEYDYWGLSG